jgi:hypothetical protein
LVSKLLCTVKSCFVLGIYMCFFFLNNIQTSCVSLWSKRMSKAQDGFFATILESGVFKLGTLMHAYLHTHARISMYLPVY